MIKKNKNGLSSRKKALSILIDKFKSDSWEVDEEFSERITPFDKRDRSFIVEIVQGTLRWHKYLSYILEENYQKKWSKTPDTFKYAVEIGLYQMLFMEKVPDYAAINETINLVKKFNGKYWSGVANGILRVIRNNPNLTKIQVNEKKNFIKYAAVNFSHPEWLVKRFVKIFKEDGTKQLCIANNKRPVYGIRINTNKVSSNDILSKIMELDKEAEASTVLDEFIKVKHIGSVVNSKLFERGYISVQDESAGLVAHLVNPLPGEIILDAAAAPGGKTCHLSELSKGQSTIISMDLRGNRLNRVFDNCRRLGHDNVFFIVGDALSLPFNKVDKVLLDAPCTGIGVLSKRADLRWKRTDNEVFYAVELQKKLLEQCAGLVKNEGILVYSTCSILPEENQKQIEIFLKNHKEFSVEKAENFVNSNVVTEEGYIFTLPHIHQIDGSFAARLKKTGINHEQSK